MYEFMANGGLQQHLYPASGMCSTNLLRVPFNLTFVSVTMSSSAVANVAFSASIDCSCS